MNLVPIRVQIGLTSSGAAKYPNFNTLATVQASGLDWSVFIDSRGSGWLYDCCGHKEEEPGSAFGIQFGMILVPAVFATQAVATFPGLVSSLTATEAEAFYNDKHSRDFEDEEINETILNTLKIKKDLNMALTARQTSALDPTTDTPGIRSNWRKTWSSYKTKKGITVA